MARILFLRPGYVPPQRDLARNQYAHLSSEHSGDILSGSWNKHRDDDELKIGNFIYHLTYSYYMPHVFQFVYDVFRFVFLGYRLHRRGEPYDFVVSYGTSKTGLIGSILKWLTGAKYIVEIPGNPAAAYKFDRVSPSFSARLKEWFSQALLRVTVSHADHLKLLYPEQVAGFSFAEKKPRSVFHDFAGVSSFLPTGEDEKYILFIGAPWHLKGVDILIKAFLNISKQFPDYTLKIIGYTPDESEFRKLAQGSTRIEFSKGVNNDLALQLISRCSLFVLPSRTETMGKVLFEARAFKKPVIASRVDGIPHYVEDGVSGLLFEPENVEDLATKMKIILSDTSLYRSLAETGYRTLHEKYSEKVYAEEFDKMIEVVYRSSV